MIKVSLAFPYLFLHNDKDNKTHIGAFLTLFAKKLVTNLLICLNRKPKEHLKFIFIDLK